MLKTSGLELENVIQEIRNLFRQNKLEKETNYATIKGIIHLFRQEKENKAIKD